jgi:hypothetical protein
VEVPINRANILLTLLSAVLIVVTSTSHGFGGSLAVGMSQLNEGAELGVSFKAKARFEAADHTVEETIYYQAGKEAAGGKLREELNVGGQDMIVIQRHDLGKLWMVMPQGFYLESDIDAPNEQVQSFTLLEHEKLGTETVNGIPTTKYKTTWETDGGRFGGYSWVTDDAIAVKADLTSEHEGEKHQIRYEVISLERTSHPDSLFEVPEGYSSMNIPGLRGLFGGDGNGGDTNAQDLREGLRGLLSR